MLVKPSRHKEGKDNYCSQKCYWGERIKNKCLTCKKEFETFPCKKKEGKGKFCSRECYHKSIEGKHHSPDTEFKKYQDFDPEKYIFIKAPEHPFASCRKQVMEHRLIVEDAIGRFLNSHEVIHHINEIKSDNRLENLYLFDSLSEHTKYHLDVRNNNRLKITKSNLIEDEQYE